MDKPNKDAKDNKGVAALSYLCILFLVPLLMKQDSKFTQYHVKQGIALFIVEIIVGFFGIIPFFGIFALPLYLVCIILVVIGVSNALNMKEKPLPLVGKLADMLNL